MMPPHGSLSTVGSFRIHASCLWGVLGIGIRSGEDTWLPMGKRRACREGSSEEDPAQMKEQKKNGKIFVYIIYYLSSINISILVIIIYYSLSIIFDVLRTLAVWTFQCLILMFGSLDLCFSVRRVAVQCVDIPTRSCSWRLHSLCGHLLIFF